MESITIDETVLTGAEGYTSSVDEKTLACSPAPVAASTVVKERWCKSRPRVSQETGGGSFLSNISGIPGDEGSDDDRLSLGLLPDNCLLDSVNDLLRQNNICVAGNTFLTDVHTTGPFTSANKSHSTNTSQRNQLQDTRSSREDNSDSHEFMTTVKKCPQGSTSGRSGGRYMPQALFQSVEEVNESKLDDTFCGQGDGEVHHPGKSYVEEPQESADSGVGQTISSGDQKSKSDEVTTSRPGVRTHSSNWEKNDCRVTFSHSEEDDEADHTVPVVQLYPEDIAELEEYMSDIDDASDEDTCDEEAAPDGDDTQPHHISVPADVKERSLEGEAHATEVSVFPTVDGLFKVPLPPMKPSATCRINTGSASTQVSSMVFGDSMQLHQSESVTEWGPSIEFGSTASVVEASRCDGVSYLADEENQAGGVKITDRKEFKDFMEHANTSEPGLLRVPLSEEEFPTGNKMSDDTAGKLCPFEDFPKDFTGMDNDGRDLWSDHSPFDDVGAEEFGEEEFMVDTDAAMAMLAEDEQKFKRDNFIADEMFNSTLSSVRGEDQTFLNMTIGTYMAARSGELGSLSSYEKRPEFGMPVQSPPFVRWKEHSGISLEPTHLPDKTFLPSDEDATKLAPELDVLKSSCYLGNNSEVFEIRSSQHISQDNISGQKLSLLRDGNPASDGPGLQQSVHTDLTQSSFMASPHQPISRTSSFHGFSEMLAQKTAINEGKVTCAGEKSFQPSDRADGRGQNLLSLSPKNAENYEFLGQSALSASGLEADLMNSTSNDVTFNSIYKLFERSDISFSDPAQLLLSAYNKKVKTKQEIKQIKARPSDNQTEKDLGLDFVKASKTNVRFQDGLKSSIKDTSFQQRNIKAYPTSQTLQLQTNTEVSGPDTGTSRSQTDINFTDETSAFSKMSAADHNTEPCNMKADKVPCLPTNTDMVKAYLSGTKMGNAQILKMSQRELSVLMSDIQPGKDLVKNILHEQTNTSLSQPETKHTQPTLNQNVVRTHKESDKAGSRPETQFSQNKASNQSTALEKDLRVFEDFFRHVSQAESDYVSMEGTCHGTTNAGSVKAPRAVPSHENLCLDQRFVKNSGSEHQGSVPSQMILLSAVPEDFPADESLESVTINSHCSVTGSVTYPCTVSSASQPAGAQGKKNQPTCMTRTQNHQSPTSMDHLLSVTTSSPGEDVSNMSQFHSLIQDNTSSVLQNTEIRGSFISSTPLIGHQPSMKKFASDTQITEKSILPVVTPREAVNILELTEVLHFPEVCCVHLSQQTIFPVSNLLDKGVKCMFSYRDVTFRGQRIKHNLCPFEMKKQVTLAPNSSDSVQVMFRPRDKGEFTVDVEVFAQNLTNPQVNRTYVIHITACAEFPALKISPANGEIDFGELLWGSMSCRSVKVLNVGRATVPLRFSIFRKESALCNFSFYQDNRTDVSSISLSTRPTAVGSVYSMTLPGMKEGQKTIAETINVYCCAKEPQNLAQSYTGEAEKFQAVLSVGVDMPVENIGSLDDIKLHTKVGTYKLHVDRDTLAISVAPGKTGQGTVKIINSGNISMHVDLALEPERDHFSLSTDHVVVPSGGHCPVHVSFTPQPTRESTDDNRVNLMLQNQITQHYISVIGKVKTAQTKISGSVTAINFGGVNLTASKKQKFTFFTDNDDDIKISIRNAGSAFKLLMEDGECVEGKHLSVVKNKKYTVWIIFTPTEVMGYSADLLVQILYANRYVIPLYGYGGCSNVLIDEVNQSQTGERWLDIGCLVPRMSTFRKITITNTGARCCFVKATFYDVSRQELQPYHATVMPSSLILSAHETKDLMIMFSPTQKEVDLCSSGRALVAFIKLIWGDEITRQHFLSDPGEQSRQLISSFDIALTSTQRESVDAELKSMTRSPTDSYSLLKKAMSTVKIGLFGSPVESQPSEQGAVVSRSESDVGRSYRSALTPVSPNIGLVGRSKDAWKITPSEIQLFGEDSEVKDFVQILNYSTEELQFSVECDEGITVIPSEGVVKPKNTTALKISGDVVYFSKREPRARCGLVRVLCLQQIKYVKVYVPGTSNKMSSPKSTLQLSPGRLSPPTTDSGHATPVIPPVRSTLSDYSGEILPRPLSRTLGDIPSHTSAVFSSEQDAGVGRRVQGSNMIIFPATEAGSKSSQMYLFTNISTEPLVWELAPLAPPYVKHADKTSNVYRANYEVFKLSPQNGILQPDEIKELFVEFFPQSKGSYNQAWCIHDSTDRQQAPHRFAVYAKAVTAPSSARGPNEQDAVPQGLSPTHGSASPRGRDINSGFSGQSLESFTTPREPAVKYATANHSGVSHNRPHKKIAGTSKLHRGDVGVVPSVKSAQPTVKFQSSAAVSTQNPGVFWTSVAQPDTNSFHRSPASTRAASVGSLTSKDVPGQDSISCSVRETGVSPVASLTSLSPSHQLGAAGDGSSFRGQVEKVPELKCIQLMHHVIEFQKLQPGESIVKKINLKNLTKEEVEVVVQREPKPPFLIKHTGFKVGKDKIVMFPVTFKPRHVAKFKDKITFRETKTGRTFTATLDAECEKKLATT